MEFIELKTISTSDPLIRKINNNFQYTQEDKIFSKFGFIHVAVQGDRTKLPVFTFHDIGLNHASNFQNFCSYHEMEKLSENLCIYHINAPGQEEDAEPFPIGIQYPTMDEIADLLGLVMTYYNVTKFFGFGVGAGANILTRFALHHPSKVEGLFLINPTSEKASWSEWLYQRRNCSYLNKTGMNAYVSDYLIWYHLGRSGYEGGNIDVEYAFTNHFHKLVRPSNLALFIQSYIARTYMGDSISNYDYYWKEDVGKLAIRCPVFLMTGVYSPHVKSTEEMYSRLNSRPECQMSKIADCGMVLEENPGKVVQTLTFFLQELGYFFKNMRKKY